MDPRGLLRGVFRRCCWVGWVGWLCWKRRSCRIPPTLESGQADDSCRKEKRKKDLDRAWFLPGLCQIIVGSSWSDVKDGTNHWDAAPNLVIARGLPGGQCRGLGVVHLPHGGSWVGDEMGEFKVIIDRIDGSSWRGFKLEGKLVVIVLVKSPTIASACASLVFTSRK